MDDKEKLALVWNEEKKELTKLGMELYILAGMQLAVQTFQTFYRILEKHKIN